MARPLGMIIGVERHHDGGPRDGAQRRRDAQIQSAAI
jgi:hypothetical protein